MRAYSRSWIAVSTTPLAAASSMASDTDCRPPAPSTAHPPRGPKKARYLKCAQAKDDVMGLRVVAARALPGHGRDQHLARGRLVERDEGAGAEPADLHRLLLALRDLLDGRTLHD